MHKKNGFTSLEKVNSFWNMTSKAEGRVKPSLAHTVGKRSSLTGFTLIEIIISLTILGIGLVSVLAYLPIALDASKKATDLTKAALIAKKYAEEIKSASFDDISAADAYDTSGIYMMDPDFGGFSYMIAVSNAGVSNTKDLSISVRWGFKGKDTTETFKTMIVKYNPT